MAKAEPGHIYATGDVLERSNTLFETTELEPFAVKGKAEPVQAWSVGRAKGSRTRQVTLQRLPLTGRNAELGVIRKAFASARSGAGRPDRDHRRRRDRQDAAARSAARRGGRDSRSCTPPARPTRRRSRTSCGASCCARCSDFGRETPPTHDIVERLRAEVATKAPDLAAVAAAARGRVRRRDRPPRPRSRCWRRRTAARSCTRPSPGSSKRSLPEQAAGRDRRRAPHGRGVGRAAGAPDGRARRAAVALRASGAAPGATGFESRRGAEVVRIDLKPLAAAGCAAPGATGDRSRLRCRRTCSKSSRSDPAAIRSSCATCCAPRSSPAASRTCRSPPRRPR